MDEEEIKQKAIDEVANIIRAGSQKGRGLLAEEIVDYLWEMAMMIGKGKGFLAGIEQGKGEEQRRMTKCLRELYKKGWTLADVIEAEDTMGGD